MAHEFTNRDRDILRPLMAAYAKAAADPVNGERRELWRRLNALQEVRPLVWINEIPWHEMDVNGELTLQCEDAFARGVEGSLRRILYQWRHMPGDMVLDPVWIVPLVCGPVSCYADYGISEISDAGAARAFHGQMQTDDDIERMKTPRVWVDHEETARRAERLQGLCNELLPIQVRGIVHQWATPWDVMIRWYGIEQLFLDMVDRPEFVHRLLARYMAIQHAVLDRQQELGLLDVCDGNHRVGSGGLGITDELPSPAPGTAVMPIHQWGCGNAQIFSEVSPDMHWEFSLKYEQPYMERFGLTYYGCCEPLHRKVGILRRIRNLRKISMSPWIDIDVAVQEMGKDFVFSYKPNPAVLATDIWHPDQARRNLQSVLEKTRGLPVELILKDISTVRSDPRRLWDWESIAMELVQNC